MTRGRRRILFLCTLSPWPADSGASLRTAGWIRQAAHFADVGVLTFIRRPEEAQALESAREFCSFVCGIPAPRTLYRKSRDALRSILTRTPYVIQAASEQAMRKALHDAILTWKPEIVQAEQIGAAPYLPRAGRLGVITVYAAHNVESRVLAGPPHEGRPRRHFNSAHRMARLERRFAREADCVVAVSDREAQWFRADASRIAVIPNAIDTTLYSFTPPSRRPRDGIVFIGHLGYPPNRDAARILALNVFPAIRKIRPEAKLVLAGAAPERWLRRINDPHIEVTGAIADISPVWRAASVFVCPLRWGAGSRLKLIEAAACGAPIVATRFSAEGLALEEQQHFVSREEPSAIAEAAASILAAPDRFDEMAQRARHRIVERHDWPALNPELARFYDDLVAHHHDPKRG